MSDSGWKRLVPRTAAERLHRWRRTLGRRVADPRLDAVAQRVAELERRVADELGREREDLLDRIDTLVSSYDRRVAALANRLLDLEDRLGRAAGAEPFDAGAVLAAHRHPARSWPPAGAPSLPWTDDDRRPESELRGYLDLLRHSAPVLDASFGPSDLVRMLEEAGVAARRLEVPPAEVAAALATLADGTQGAVCLLGVVEHLYPEEAQSLLGAVVAVLRPGGVLVADSIHPGSLWASARVFGAHPTHARLYQPRALRAMAEKAGLEVSEVRELDAVAVAGAGEDPARADGRTGGLDLSGPHGPAVESMLLGPRRFALVARAPGSAAVP